MDFHNIVAFGIVVAVCIWFSHGDLRQQKRQALELRCPDKWYYFQGSCFFYSVNRSPVTWDYAQVLCFLEGAQLVEIESAAELAFLFNLKQTGIHSDTWIGLKVVDDTYIWYPSGNTSSYTNWAIDQPDNDKSLENCVEMYEDGKWNDNICTKQRSYFCEKSSIDIA